VTSKETLRKILDLRPLVSFTKRLDDPTWIYYKMIRKAVQENNLLGLKTLLASNINTTDIDSKDIDIKKGQNDSAPSAPLLLRMGF
jgi:hypothetical protein